MSKVISFQIPKSDRTFIQYQEDRGRYFYNSLHQHQQCQLTTILEGKGQLLVGDYVGRFAAGDMFLFGENIPHVFRSDSDYFEAESKNASASNTIFFDFDVIRNGFNEVAEFESLFVLSGQIKGCYKIEGSMKEEIERIFEHFKSSSTVTRLWKSIQILSIIHSDFHKMNSLNPIFISKPMSEQEGKRMDQIMRFILDNSHRHISLEEVSDQAHMSNEAFCRFFKLRTRKTFTQFVQQLRITEAKKLLIETDLAISEVSFQVGFHTLSHFNKTFKNLTNMTPKDWRRLE